MAPVNMAVDDQVASAKEIYENEDNQAEPCPCHIRCVSPIVRGERGVKQH